MQPTKFALRAGAHCFILCLVAAVMAGCAGPVPDRGAHYPVELTAVASTAVFPLKAAGYPRDRVFAYGPDHRYYSAGYDRPGDDFSHTVIFFAYDAVTRASYQYQAEKAGVLKAHADATLLSESTTTLTGAEAGFPARIADFEYEDLFGGTIQRVRSRLVFIQHEDRCLKIRSTAPVAHAQVAEQAMAALLGEINWGACLAAGEASTACAARGSAASQ